MADSVFTDTPVDQKSPATPQADSPASGSPKLMDPSATFTFDEEGMAAFAAQGEADAPSADGTPADAALSGDGQAGGAPEVDKPTPSPPDDEAPAAAKGKAAAEPPSDADSSAADDYQPTQEDIDEWTALTQENERLKAQQTELSALQELMQHPTFAQYAQKAIQEIAAGGAVPTQNGHQQAPAQMQAAAQQQPKLEKRPMPEMPEDIYDAEAMKRYHADMAAAVAHNTRVETEEHMQQRYAPQFQTLATIEEQQAQQERVQRMASDFARAGADEKEALALAQSDPATLVRLVVAGHKAQSRSGEKKVPAPPSLPKVPPRRTAKESAAGKVPPSGTAASGAPVGNAEEKMFTVTETKPSVFPV